MGFAGAMHPYFKPSFDNLENLRLQMNESTETEAGGGVGAGRGDLYESIKDQDTALDGEDVKGEASQLDVEEEVQEEEDEDMEVVEVERVPSLNGNNKHREAFQACADTGNAVMVDQGMVDSALRSAVAQSLPLPLPLPLPLQGTKVSHILAFLPTGWAASSSFNERNSSMTRDGLTVRAIPYR